MMDPQQAESVIELIGIIAFIWGITVSLFFHFVSQHDWEIEITVNHFLSGITLYLMSKVLTAETGPSENGTFIVELFLLLSVICLLIATPVMIGGAVLLATNDESSVVR